MSSPPPGPLLLALTTGLSRKLAATNVQLTLMEQH